MMTVTQRAAAQIKLSAASLDEPGRDGDDAQTELVLRIAAQRRADRSIEYAMGYDEVGMTDTRLRFHGVDVVVSATSEHLLEGATLDFVELAPDDRQFVFLNPNDPTYVPPNDEADANDEQRVDNTDKG